MKYLWIPVILIAGNASMETLAFQLLFMLGCWKIFKKCGEKPWKALIPCYNRYCLARCANRESEGRLLSFAFALIVIAHLVALFVESSAIALLMTGIIVAVDMIYMIYVIQVGIGLCELFKRRKRWVLFWVLADGIVTVIWGFAKAFQPQWTVQDYEQEVDTYFSNAHAEVMSEGLTVNLEERTTKEAGRKKMLLRDIHMNIAPGHMVLLLGGSGAGKTTLLNAINGYEKAKAEVHLNGNNVYTQYKLMQYEIGFVPQSDLMRVKDTVVHTLYDAADLRLPEELTKEERRKRVREVMELFGLTRAANTMVEKMSGGQRKRLSIAMEFISDPSLFILDEPDSGLDGVMARELMQQLREIANHGKIVIVITHTPDRVIDLFDDVIVLAKDSSNVGRLAYYGPIDSARKFFERETMEEVVLTINRKDEGGEGRADEFVQKYGEVQQNG